MIQRIRKCVLDIFDYNGNIVCPLFDNYANVSGQASEVHRTTDETGWEELHFVIPSTCFTEEGVEDNFRLQYLKADYKIRMLDDSPDGQHWFIISEPKVIHKSWSKNVQVSAGSASQSLKTKNLSLEFKDENKNNTGDAKYLLGKILEGTDWEVGYVHEFNDRNGSYKERTLKAETQTGCFRMISDMCKLFDAKPIYHTAKPEYDDDGNIVRRYKCVDIVPINPINKTDEHVLPDIDDRIVDNVMELHYGRNVKNISRTMSTEDMITKLYVYGAYGTKTYGYCSIDECQHREFYMRNSDAIQKGQTVSFMVQGPDESKPTMRHFTADEGIDAGSVFVYSFLDPCSMMYIWRMGGTNERAYFIENGEGRSDVRLENIEPQQEDENDTVISEEIPYRMTDNIFSFMMSYDYHRKVGLLNAEILQYIARYQREAPALYRKASKASAAMSEAEYELSSAIGGNINYCRLKVKDIGSTDGLLTLILDNEGTEDGRGVIYRTDYDQAEVNYFNWAVTPSIDKNGDPLNPGAAMLYVVHQNKTGKMYPRWDKCYLKTKLLEDGTLAVGNASKPNKLVFHMRYDEAMKDNENHSAFAEDDHFFLFQQNSINGYLGYLESVDEAVDQSLEDAMKQVTLKHPVFFGTDYHDRDTVTENITGYSWRWCYAQPAWNERMSTFQTYGLSSGSSNIVDQESMIASKSRMYFTYPADNNEKTWHRVFFSEQIPTNMPVVKDSDISSNGTYVDGQYYYNWRSAVLYRFVSGAWVPLDTYAQEKVSALFGTVFSLCKQKDKLYYGTADKYRYTVTGHEYGTDEPMNLPAGNYFFESPYKTYWLFSTDTDLPPGSEIVYDTKTGWTIERPMSEFVDENGTVLETKPVDGNSIKCLTYSYNTTRRHRKNIFMGDNGAFDFEEGALDPTDGLFLDKNAGQVVQFVVEKEAYDVDKCSRTRSFIPVVPNTTYVYETKGVEDGASMPDLYMFCYDYEYHFINVAQNARDNLDTMFEEVNAGQDSLIKESSPIKVTKVRYGDVFTTNDSTEFVKFVITKPYIKQTEETKEPDKEEQQKDTALLGEFDYSTFENYRYVLMNSNQVPKRTNTSNLKGYFVFDVITGRECTKQYFDANNNKEFWKDGYSHSDSRWYKCVPGILLTIGDGGSYKLHNIGMIYDQKTRTVQWRDVDSKINSNDTHYLRWYVNESMFMIKNNPVFTKTKKNIKERQEVASAEAPAFGTEKVSKPDPFQKVDNILVVRKKIRDATDYVEQVKLDEAGNVVIDDDGNETRTIYKQVYEVITFEYTYTTNGLASMLYRSIETTIIPPKKIADEETDYEMSDSAFGEKTVYSLNIHAVDSYDRQTNNIPQLIIASNVNYKRLKCTEINADEQIPDSEDRLSLLHYVKLLRDLSDKIYMKDGLREVMDEARAEQKKLEDLMTSSIGDLYREGYWKDDSYVDGDEQKLYTDAFEKIEDMSKPNTTYQIGYLDLYEANTKDEMEFGSYHEILYPDVTINSAVHLVDADIGINTWAYVKRVDKWYDQPWKTTIQISTKLTDFYAHTFEDVIANVVQATTVFSSKIDKYDTFDIASLNTAQIAEVYSIIKERPPEQKVVATITYDDVATDFGGTGYSLGSAMSAYTGWKASSSKSGGGSGGGGGGGGCRCNGVFDVDISTTGGCKITKDLTVGGSANIGDSLDVGGSFKYEGVIWKKHQITYVSEIRKDGPIIEPYLKTANVLYLGIVKRWDQSGRAYP